MTKAKRWPNTAEWARMEAVALAGKGIALLKPVVMQTSELGTIEIVRRTAEAIDAMREIQSKLNEVKGKTE